MPALPPYSALSLVSATLSGGLALYALRREEPGARPFAVMMGFAMLWAFSYGMALLVFDPWLRRIVETLVWAGTTAVPVAWLIFALEYTGRGDLISGKRVALLSAVPAASVLLVATEQVHGLMWRSYSFGSSTVTTVVYAEGPLLLFSTIYAYVLIGIGMALILEMLLTSGSLYSGQALALTAGAATPLVANVLWLFNVTPLPGLDPTPIAVSITGLAFVVGLFHHDMLGLAPAARRVGKRTAIDDLGDGVLIVDDENRVVSMNNEAERVLGWSSEDALGDPVSRVFGTDIDTDAGTVTTTLDTTEGRRSYEVTVSPVTDVQGRAIGDTLVLHDVTERKRRQERLAVLNRVLRHNLRNDVTVIQGYASMLSKHLDGQDAEMATEIETQATDLVDLGEKARSVEEVMRAEDTTKRIAVEDRLDVILERLRGDYPDATISVDAADAEVDASPAILDAVLRNLLENAVEHSSIRADSQARQDAVDHSQTKDDDHAPVQVTVRRRGEWVVITVSDDGPGIPESERQPIVEGEETAMQHGSGLGLWLVRWGVTTLGGNLEFETNGPGTTVVVELPAPLSAQETESAGQTASAD